MLVLCLVFLVYLRCIFIELSVNFIYLTTENTEIVVARRLLRENSKKEPRKDGMG
ncbi:MAG: hypothetical protein FWG98_00010 [Candidatus Cloacimonetes bacterium]|nr:hypothetical protein [Candidatus Cloacimonadota bacterium]